MQDWGSKALLVGWGWGGVKSGAERDICNSSGAGSLGSAAAEWKGCCACLNEAPRLAWKPCSRPLQPLQRLLCPLYSTNWPSSVGCCQSVTTVGFALFNTLKVFWLFVNFLTTNTRWCLVWKVVCVCYRRHSLCFLLQLSIYPHLKLWEDKISLMEM